MTLRNAEESMNWFQFQEMTQTRLRMSLWECTVQPKRDKEEETDEQTRQ